MGGCWLERGVDYAGLCDGVWGVARVWGNLG